MAWGKGRGGELPADWSERRLRCLQKANGRCEATVFDSYPWEWPTPAWIGPDERCIRTATDVDHRSDRDNHDDLQALCSDHHKQKTNRESAAGRAAMWKKLRHEPERPPGLL